MGAHSTRRNGRAFAIAGRGALTASAAIALVGGGAGVAFAGDAPDSSSSDKGHDSWGHEDKGHDKGDHDGWGHDKGDHDGWGHDKCDDHGKKWDSKEEGKGLLDLGSLMGSKDEDYKKDDCYDHDMKWDGEHGKKGPEDLKKSGLPTEKSTSSSMGEN